MLRRRITWFSLLIAPFPALHALRALGDPPPATQATNDAHQPPLEPVLGVDLNHDRAVAAVVLLEMGRTDAALDSMRKLSRQRDPGRSIDQTNELRLGYAFVLVRAGETTQARRVLLPLARLKDKPSMSHRAAILLELADSVPSRKRRDAEPLSRAAWRRCVEQYVVERTTGLKAIHDRMASAVGAGDWNGASREFDAAREILTRVEYVTLDSARLERLDLVVAHAGAMASCVRDINVMIAERIRRASDLAGRMSTRYDARSGRRGYIPADVVQGYNAVVADIVAANALGERLVTEYLAAIAQSQERVRRDSSVKMSKSVLPQPRSVF
jgi:hypothetical protein